MSHLKSHIELNLGVAVCFFMFYLSHSQILSFIYITISIFIFDGVTAKSNSVSSSRLVLGSPSLVSVLLS